VSCKQTQVCLIGRAYGLACGVVKSLLGKCVEEAGSILECVIEKISLNNPSGSTGCEVDWGSNRNGYREYFLEVKAACVWDWQTYNFQSPFHWIILQTAIWPWRWFSRNQKFVPGIFPAVREVRLVGLTNLPLSCADCHEIWEPRRPGNFRACNWIAVTFNFFSRHCSFTTIQEWCNQIAATSKQINQPQALIVTGKTKSVAVLLTVAGCCVCVSSGTNGIMHPAPRSVS